MAFGLNLLLALLAVWAQAQSGQAQNTQTVTSAPQLLAALNSQARAIRCAGTLLIDRSVWPSNATVTLARGVTVSAVSGSVCSLAFADDGIFMRLAPSGALTLQGLTVVIEPQPAAQGTISGPLPTVDAGTGTISLNDVVLFANFSTLQAANPAVWASSSLNLVDAVSGFPVNSTCSGACRLDSFTLGDTTSMQNVVVLAARAGAYCYEQGALAYDSATLSAALVTRASQVFVFQDVILSPMDFNYTRYINVTWPLHIYACPGTKLDLNHGFTRGALTIRDGGALSFQDIILDNTHTAARVFWPSRLALLISFLDVLPGGSVTFLNVAINHYANSTESNPNLVEYLRRPRFTGSNAPNFTVTSQGSAVKLHNWRLDRSVWPQVQPTPAALAPEDAYWEFSNVLVTAAASTSCFPGGTGIRVSDGKRLRDLLAEELFPRIELAGDIKLVPSEWPPEASNPAGSLLNITHSVEIRACHSDPGSRYIVDFSDLGQVIFVFGNMTWSGDIHMINPRASPRRSWLYLLIGALSVETDGIIHFEDVLIDGNVPSPFHNAVDPFWTTECGSLCSSFIPDTRSFRNLSYYDVFIYNYRFYKTEWVFVSQNRPINGTGFWSYKDVSLIWRQHGPTPTSKPQGGGGDGVPVAAIVVPVVIGSIILLAVAALLYYKMYYKPRRAAQEALKVQGAQDSVSLQQPPNIGDSDKPADTKGSQVDSVIRSTVNTATEARIEDMRRHLTGVATAANRGDQIQLCELLGEGTFGKVYKGYWRGTLVAVKSMVFPANMSGKEKREKMAVMETAISSSLSHPNIVQTYTYAVQPVKGEAQQMTTADGQSFTVEAHSQAFLTSTDSNIHSWEVRLVLEFCDRGSLRDALDAGVFLMPAAGDSSAKTINYAHVVQTALDIARAVLHLHAENIIHSDLKARNVLLKSSGNCSRGFTAKVADFGLSVRIDPGDTHVSNVFQGTITHMAPEILIQGKISKSSDVYAYGILLWELYTGGHAFKGVPRALLGHEITKLNKRPDFPPDTPFEYQLLACRCWESDASIRPDFRQILEELERLESKLGVLKSQSVNFNTVSISTAGGSESSGGDAVKAAAVIISQQQPHSEAASGTNEWSATADSFDSPPDYAARTRLPFMQPIVEEAGNGAGGAARGPQPPGSSVGLTNQLMAIDGIKFSDLSTAADMSRVE